MKICPKCDAQNANNAPVCKHCGANLNEIPEANEPEILGNNEDEIAQQVETMEDSLS